jgi:uncharacterized protein YcsI (UPF0317 family)
MIEESSLGAADAATVRRLIRAGERAGPTTGLALGYVQANLVILPESLAGDFLDYCSRNSQAMPVLDVTEPGDPHPRQVAPDADIRTDVPRYRVYRDGELEAEVVDVTDLWGPDSVAVLLGCSFTAEAKLLQAGVRLRHIEIGKNVPMYRTNRLCIPSAHFHGPLVVSMRPIQRDQVTIAENVTARYPLAHGAPVQVGHPEELDIDLSHPDWGDDVEPNDDELPVFWACGVTPQAAIMVSGPERAITHAPGHMFITDLRDEEIERQTPPFTRRGS